MDSVGRYTLCVVLYHQQPESLQRLNKKAIEAPLKGVGYTELLLHVSVSGLLTMALNPNVWN